ncbi:hypothetical protein [[Pseudomonas] boreopolis]|uniref:hypothetical protein n=1 Tax=Xanthomonas boreopolis TaxID=86183 RepID=UPI003D9BCE97
MTIVAAFASPLGAYTAQASRTVAGKHLEWIRTRLAGALRGIGHASAAAWLAGSFTPRGSAWRPEVGLARTALAANRAELAALQLAAISAEDTLSLRMHLGEPSILAVDGWIVPVRGTTSVESADGQLQVESELRRFEFSSDGRRMTPAETSGDGLWKVRAIGDRLSRYAIESAMGFSAGNFPWPATSHALTGLLRDSVASRHANIDALDRALELISESSPEHMEWINCVVDGFLLAAGPASYGISSPDFPGLIALSSSGNELDYAEAVVAETCRQYMFQLLLVSPLTATGVEEIHYIPARRFYLTTRRALVAAHVHANVILVLNRLVGSSGYSDSVRLRIARRRLMLDTDCLHALDRSIQLTDTGRELYSRIQELIAHSLEIH